MSREEFGLNVSDDEIRTWISVMDGGRNRVFAYSEVAGGQAPKAPAIPTFGSADRRPLIGLQSSRASSTCTVEPDWSSLYSENVSCRDFKLPAEALRVKRENSLSVQGLWRQSR